MQLKRSIYYQSVGSHVYLRNVDTKKDYLFNAITFDVLEYCKNQTDLDELLEHLFEIYDIDDQECFRQDIRQFTGLLIQEGVLEDASSNTVAPKEGKTNILTTVEDLCMKQNQLFSVALELTYRCNERCIHCYVDGECAKERELTLAEYEDLLRQLRELGCLRLLLTGGEVCLKPEFLDIVRYAVSLGMLVDVYTNGLGLNMELFRALCDLKVNSVSFSLYGGDAESHDRITQVPGSFDKTLHWLALFHCAGVDTYIKSVAIRQNAEALEGLYQLGQRLGIPVETAFTISDSQTGQSAKSFRLEDYEAYRQARQICLRYKGTRSTGSRNLDGPACLAGRISLSVDPYGGVHPCVAFTEAIGSIREEPLRVIWEETPLLCRLRNMTFRDICPDCGACPDADFCAVCPGDTYSSTGAFGPSADACLLAQALRECCT